MKFSKTESRKLNFAIKNIHVKMLKLIKMWTHADAKKLNEHDKLTHAKCSLEKQTIVVSNLKSFAR